MGIFEQVLGNWVIPVCFVVLMLLANGMGRRKLNGLILGVLGIDISVKGFNFKLINCMILTNFIYIFSCLGQIHRLNALYDAKMMHDDFKHADHHVDPHQRAEHQKQLFVTYRNMLMNVCSIVLISCINVATS